MKLPEDYPEVSPDLDVEIIRGLGPEQKEILLNLAIEEAEQFVGMPAMYSVCEKIREWLGDHNEKGLDDQSMHAQMLRKAKEEEQRKVGGDVCKYRAYSSSCARCFILFISTYLIELSVMLIFL